MSDHCYSPVKFLTTHRYVCLTRATPPPSASLQLQTEKLFRIIILVLLLFPFSFNVTDLKECIWVSISGSIIDTIPVQKPLVLRKKKLCISSVNREKRCSQFQNESAHICIFYSSTVEITEKIGISSSEGKGERQSEKLISFKRYKENQNKTHLPANQEPKNERKIILLTN